MSDQTVLNSEAFEIMTGEDPTDWPERFAPGTYAKAVTHGEGIWTKIVPYDGEAIRAALANNSRGPRIKAPCLVARTSLG